MRQHNRQAVGQSVALQARIETIPGAAQHAAELTFWHQRAATSRGAEAFDERLVGLQLAHQRPQADLFRRHGQHHAAPGTSHRAGHLQCRQILHDLMQVVPRQAAEFARQGVDAPVMSGRLASEQHEHAERDVGGCKQAHGLTPINWY